MIVVFDLSGVFFNEGLSVAVQTIAKKFNLDSADVEFVLNGDFAKEYRTGLITTEEFWQKAATHWQFNDDQIKEIQFIFFGAYVPEPATVELLKQLKSLGIQTAYLSNNPEDRAKFLDQKYNFLSLFDFGLFSFEAHAWKPDKLIFEKFMQNFSVESRDIIYIEDREKHIKPAKELGWQTILFKDVVQAKADLEQMLGVKIG